MRAKKVAKFGGSSLANAECFKKAVKIIIDNRECNPVIVVSAVGVCKEAPVKITDSLKEAGLSLLSGKEADDKIKIIIDRHESLIKDLELDENLIQPEIERLMKIVENIRNKQYETKEEALDAIMGFGEILSAKIMASLLSKNGLEYSAADPFEYDFITTDRFQNADILEESLEKIASRIIGCSSRLVFPGYVGFTKDGKPTTLGRGGSDYSAAILGAALKRDVEIWTDVNGVYRIAPSHLPPQFKALGHPETIPELSYEEAFQMAAFGSRVLYEKTLAAVASAVRKGKHIRIHVKNTFNPERPGTVVSSMRHNTGIPRGITCLEGTQLFNIYTGLPEDSAEVSKALESIPDVNVELSSETFGRLSFVFNKYHPLLSKLESKFNSHLSRDQVLVKIVGDGLGENPRMLSKIHSALQSAENPEKYGMTIVHKSPQLLTDNTFEFIVKKRGLSDVLLALYKDLFMEKTVTVGMLGMGTVGSGVLRYCREMFSSEKAGFDFQFPTVMVRNPDKKRDVNFSGKLTTDANDVLDDPLVDIVLEVMGGIEPARKFILEALKKGKHVVTANKALLAEHGPEIFETAFKYGKNLGFEASVCAEIPIIDDFLTFPGLADIRGIEGIVNGTSNYVLSRFMEGMSFEEAVKIAQEKGFAEADPFMDVSGTDAAQKLSILSSILFNQPINYRDIQRQGIDGLSPFDLIAFDRWKVIIKPLVMAKKINNKLMLRVSPVLVPKEHALSSVQNENNALALYLEGREEPITKIGKGAGAIPTARSIVRDLLDVSRKARAYMVDLPSFFKTATPREMSNSDDFEARWYLRFTVSDTSGVLGKIATIIGDFDLSINHVHQEEVPEESTAYILIELKKAPWDNLKRAVDMIERFPFVRESYTCMML